MPDAPGQPLAYAPPPPRRVLRQCAAGLVVLVALGSVLLWGRPISRYAARRYRVFSLYLVQRDCLAYVAPPDRLVYDDSALPDDALRSSRVELAATDPRPAEYAPAAWTRFDAALAAVQGPYPAAANGGISVDYWKGLYVHTRPLRSIIFLHELRTPAGERRLVCVAAEPEQLVCRTWVPGTVTSPARSPETDTYYGTFWGTGGHRLKFFAGQPDPADPTRFTFRFELDGQPARLAGRLGDDGRIRLWGYGWFRESKPPTGFWDLRGSKNYSAYDDRDYPLHDGAEPDRRIRAERGTLAVAFVGESAIATASTEALRVWRLADDGQRLREAMLPGGRLDTFAFSPDGRALVVWDYGEAWSLVDTATGRAIRLRGPGGYAHFTSDSRILAVAREDSVARWDVRTGEPLDPVAEKRWGFPYLRGAVIAVKPPPAAIFTVNGKPVPPPERVQRLTQAAFPPSGDQVVTRVDGDHRLETFDVYDDQTGRLVHRRTPCAVFDVGYGPDLPKWSPDGRWLARAGQEAVYLWRPAPGSPTYRLPLSAPGIRTRRTAVAFSPDGRTLAGSAEDDPEIRLWYLDAEGCPKTRTLPVP